MKKRIVAYWLLAWIFTIIFGEVLTGIISNNPSFFQNAFPITIYYGVITYIFAFLFSKMKYWIVLIIVFIYGALVELLFFKGINVFLVAGLFYVFLFGTPYLIMALIWKKDKPR